MGLAYSFKYHNNLIAETSFVAFGLSVAVFASGLIGHIYNTVETILGNSEDECGNPIKNLV